MSRTPSEQDWRNNESRIKTLYKNHDLKHVMEAMARDGFVAPAKTYKQKLKQWGAGKHLSTDEWILVARLLLQLRDANVRDPAIWVHHAVRRQSDIKRHCRSKKINFENFEALARATAGPLPAYVYPYVDDKGLVDEASESQSQSESGPAHDGAAMAMGHRSPVECNKNDATDDSVGHGVIALDSYRMERLSPPQDQHRPSVAAPGDTCILSQTSRLSTGTDPLEASEDAYITSCQLTCLYDTLRHEVNRAKHLAAAISAFRNMCTSNLRSIVLVASVALTWLLLHANGSIAEIVMSHSHATAADILGEQSPVAIVLEWMTAVVGANGFPANMRACNVGTQVLWHLVELSRLTTGCENSQYIVITYCLGFNLMFVDQSYREAEVLLQKLWPISVSVLGRNHTQTINIMSAISRAQSRQGHYVEALQSIELCLSVFALGPNDPHYLELLVRKAIICWKLERYNDAQSLYWMVLRGRAAVLGRHHRATLAAHASLYDCLNKTGDWEGYKAEYHEMLVNPRMTVIQGESWWRDNIEAHRQQRLNPGADVSDDEQ